MITQQIFQKNTSTNKLIESYRFLGALAAIFIFIASLTIFQDFLDSNISGYSFYFSESILFKTIWFLFIPFLAILYKMLQNENLQTLSKTALFIVIPIFIHLIILQFVFLLFSTLFYEGRYDLYKIFTYTLANDFYKLVLIYATFVLGYKYFLTSTIPVISDRKTFLENIVINNGKDNTIVKTNDILKITSATPYISIHLENKKYLQSETLKSICKQLDNTIFVRVHKSTVVNIKSVVSYKSRLNGDYDLLLKNGDEIRLSRTYATHFKKLFNTNHRVTT